MRIIFTDSAGEVVQEVLAAGRDHWDACLIGHQMMIDGIVKGAEDFDVIEITRGRGNIDVNEETAIIGVRSTA